MRNNYQIAAVNARELFLEWNQCRMIERCGLKADEKHIFVRYLSKDYRIERSSGRVLRGQDGNEAEFNEVMAIYDLLCRDTPLPEEKRDWKAVHALAYAGLTSPSDSKLSAKTAAFLQKNLRYVDKVLHRIGCESFPIGDHAAVFTVFDCMHAVFQMWEGDDEFPPVVRYMWDVTAPSRLKFETLWYVMNDFEKRLIHEVEQLVKEE